MPQFSKLWFSLLLGSLIGTASFMAASSLSATVVPTQAIAQANPCASKNPYASKKVANVGGPLAKELQGKPVVVDIYATWCPACQKLAPMLSQLKKDYNGKAHFVILDVSDQAKVRQSEAKAKQLGLEKFFAANKSQTAMVAIVDPATGNILAQHRKNPSRSAYTSVLDAAIAKK